MSVLTHLQIERGKGELLRNKQRLAVYEQNTRYSTLPHLHALRSLFFHPPLLLTWALGSRERYRRKREKWRAICTPHDSQQLTKPTCCCSDCCILIIMRDLPAAPHRNLPTPRRRRRRRHRHPCRNTIQIVGARERKHSAGKHVLSHAQFSTVVLRNTPHF